MELDRPSVRRMREAVNALAMNPDGAAASTYRGETGDGEGLVEMQVLNALLQGAKRVVVTVYFEGEDGADVFQAWSGSGVRQVANGRNVTQVANVNGGSITQVAGDINIGGGQ